MKRSLCFLFLLCGTAALPAVEFETAGRYAFYRNEKDAFLEVCATDASSLPAEILWRGRSVKLPKPGSDGTVLLRLPVETRRFPGAYTEKLVCGGREFPLSYRIGPEAVPLDMPILFWGFKCDHRVLQDMGFNSGILYGCLMDTPKNAERLERAVADGFRYLDSISTNGEKDLKDLYPCVRRNGTPNPRSVDASNPEVVKRMLKRIEKFPLRRHPAAAGSLVNSEVRAAGATPSFMPHQMAAWKKFSGKDVPPEVDGRVGPHYSRFKDFPADRVVPDDHPLLEYYKWYWRTGDGWNDLNTRMAEALRKKARPGFFCFHDPVVRTPPIWSSGGKVEAVNHWTYAYPEPFRITSHIDSMFAMTENDDPPRKVFAMTQIICYRSRITNRKVKLADPPAWSVKFPKAEYVSIPPDSLQEAVWTMISRPVKGVLFHGEGSLHPMPVNRKKLTNYFCTNDETRAAMKKVLTGAVQPLAPILPFLGERPGKIAILHSFASSIFAGRGTWGSGGWPDDLSLMLYYAGMNPRVIYEEGLLKNGLAGIRVLAMPHCDVLPAGVAEKIRAFQLEGGIVVGDPDLCPAIVPQVMLRQFDRRGGAEKTGARLLRNASRLRKQLRPFVKIDSETDNMELLRFERVWKNARYYFIVNDRRGPGDYVGPWNAIREKGLPNKGVLTVTGKAGAVYELSRGGRADFEAKDGKITIPVSFETNDGRVFLPLEKPIGKVVLELPSHVTAGEKFSIRGKILDVSGRPVSALLPVKLDISDGKGRALDCGPYRGAPDGIMDYSTVCPVDAADVLRVKLTDRASGLSAEGSVKIRKAE